jgi:hypothetical protein
MLFAELNFNHKNAVSRKYNVVSFYTIISSLSRVNIQLKCNEDLYYAKYVKREVKEFEIAT